MNEVLNPKSFFGAFDIAFFVPGAILFLGLLIFVVAPAIEKPVQPDISMAKVENAPPTDTPFPKQSQQESLQRVTTAGPIASDCSHQSDDAQNNKLSGSAILLAKLFTVTPGTLSLFSIVQLAIFIVCIYTLGLFTHALSWLFYHRIIYETCRKKCICAKKREQVEDTDAWVKDQKYFVKFVDYFWYLRSTSWNSATAIILVLAVRKFAITMDLMPHDTHLSDVVTFATITALIVSIFLIGLGFQFGSSCRKTQNIVRLLNP